MCRSQPTKPILIAGPTASGKSTLALRLADALGGTVVNTDSMQVYDGLRVLTARPGLDNEARVPHRLYGHTSPFVAYSVGQYVKDASRVLDDIASQGRRPIFVGGTGLYFKALLEGLSPIPEIAPDVRARWRQFAQRHDASEVHQALMEMDPVMAQRLQSGDRQRVVRALEVMDQTGVSLSVWQQTKGEPVLCEDNCIQLVASIDRAALQARADERFVAMAGDGAMEEVAALMELQLDPALPVMRAIGVNPLARYLAGEISQEAAIGQGQLETRQYIKRQQTWLKRYMMSWKRLDAQQMERSIAEIVTFIEN
jgi:tRNA dimethylallyltransferase